MGNFFKKVGTGFLVVILLPFMIVFFALFAIYAVLKFIVLWFIAVSKFFVGEKITDPLDIDRKAANLFEKEQEGKKANAAPSESGKFAGATINIYSNREVDPSFSRPISHFDSVNTQLDAHDLKQLKSVETKAIEHQDMPLIDEVEDDD